jgi:repressor LexA
MAPSNKDKDAEYLGRLRDYYAENRRIPSWQRIAELMGFSSRTASRRLLERLESANFVERTTDDDAWIPGKRFFERPLINASVRAGNPEMVEGTDAEPFLIDNYLVREPSSTVLVTVRGDSMIEAGIYDGDRAVVNRKLPAKLGNFVVAIVDNEFTLKELGREQGKFILIPHNKAYAVIRPKGELEIYGVMTGLVRRFTH